MYEGGFAGSCDPPQNAGAQWNTLSQGLCCGACLGLDLDVLGHIVEKPNADVIEAEVFLDMADDLSQHLLGIFT